MPVGRSERLHIPELDGLRFFAFLAVLFHHLPPSPWTYFLQQRGWIGVDLFFVISSYLFFTLFEREHARSGKIDISKFYIRRLLRLYPLMIAFPLAMAIITSSVSKGTVVQLAGIASFVDNFAVWVRGYKTAIPYTAHLWTLAFEYQVYLLIPLAFTLYQGLGRTRFLAVLAGIWAFNFVARAALLGVGAQPTMIWVTPFLHADAVLAGIALSLAPPRSLPRPFLLVLITGCAVGLMLLPSLEEARLGAVAIYPLAAIACVSGAALALSGGKIRAFLSSRSLVYLGTISFGLYVFHLAVIAYTKPLVVQFGTERAGLAFLLHGFLALVGTVLCGSASYYGFERFWLRKKDKFAAIQTRLA